LIKWIGKIEHSCYQKGTRIMKNKAKLSISINFEEIKLPPFQDILILTRKCQHGKIGITKSYNLLAPNEFELVELEDPTVEAILINKKIIKRLPAQEIIKILKDKVFPYLTTTEIVKVDFEVVVIYKDIEFDMEEQGALKSSNSQRI